MELPAEQKASHPSGDAIIQAVGLKKNFPGTKAIDGISLELRRGEILCIIGPNGAGKTTLLYLLGGVIFPSAGHVTVFGLHRWKQNFEIRKRSTFLPAQPVYGANPTPYEFLRFFGQIYGIPKPEFVERIKILAAQMNMTEHLHKAWEKLSLGMQKKAGLIAAFLPDAEIRFFDEPFAGGIDPLAMERLYEWMALARGRGETIAFSTQVLEQAESVADRITLLQNGVLRFIDKPQDLIRRAGIDPAQPRALAKAFLILTQETKGNSQDAADD